VIDYPAAVAVAKVVQTGSFEKAAQALGVTPSAISQRVKSLEERFGAVLIERGSPCVATEKGAWLCRHLELVGMLETELLAHLPGAGAGQAQPVTLDIAVNADSLGTWFLPAAAEYAASSTTLLNIAVDDQEHTAEWLRRGRVLAAVTSLAEPVSGCKVTSLGRLRYHATASPDFMARHFAHGVTRESLATAPALTFNQKDRLQQDWAEATLGRVADVRTHWLPSTQGFVEAALLGMGWCLNPIHLVREHLEAGRLVELVPGATLDVPLYWQISRMAAEHFAGLTRAVTEAGKKALL